MRGYLLSLVLVTAAVTALAGCGTGNGGSACNDPGGSSMCAGDDCLSCHGFKAAGTVYAAGGTTPVGSATVTLVDHGGATVTRTTNSAGNFYTSSALGFPLQRVTVSKGGSTITMNDVGSGHCNDCHDAAFRIQLP
jgi:ABC-type phosphate transport system substrate-binding protein